MDESNDPVIDTVDNFTNNQEEKIEKKIKKSKKLNASSTNATKVSNPSKSNGLNYTAIIMMTLMLLPAILTAGMKVWDYFYPDLANQRQFRSRLLRCYNAANPDKLHTIDDILKKYKGKEHILFSKLKSKYENIDDCQ